MAVQTVVNWRPALCLAATLLSPIPSWADDAAPAKIEVARPSVEESAVQPPVPHGRESGTREAMCLMIESAARSNDLPLEFFARVIWQESRFQSDAVGPVTRNGKRAQGIAQFMPGTASERRLLDPFDPVQALPKSAEFLSELRKQLGNLGLAAAAEKAGPRRVEEMLSGSCVL
jgi:soluble lytic murein transglycosylase-like protein